MAAPTCTSADVAELVPERVGSTGGDFTATTTPPQVKVNDLIAKTIQEVIAAVGPTVDSSLAAYATMVVATGAAARVELAFTNAMARDPQSKYAQLWSQYWGDDPKNVGGMLKLLADAQSRVADGIATGVSDIVLPWGEFPLTTATDPAGVPVTLLTERY